MPPGGRRSGLVDAVDDKAGSAPRASSSFTTSAWPSAAAHISAVWPRNCCVFGVGAAIEQQLHGRGIARVGRQHQHRLAFGREHGVRILAGIEQARDDGRVAVDWRRDTAASPRCGS